MLFDQQLSLYVHSDSEAFCFFDAVCLQSIMVAFEFKYDYFCFWQCHSFFFVVFCFFSLCLAYMVPNELSKPASVSVIAWFSRLCTIELLVFQSRVETRNAFHSGRNSHTNKESFKFCVQHLYSVWFIWFNRLWD